MAFLKKEVEQILRKTGKKLKTDFFDIFISPKTQQFSRILVITSKKVGNAPKRNQLRRRLKSIFHEGQFMNQDFDLILIAKQGSTNLTFNQLREILNIIKND